MMFYIHGPCDMGMTPKKFLQNEMKGNKIEAISELKAKRF